MGDQVDSPHARDSNLMEGMTVGTERTSNTKGRIAFSSCGKLTSVSKGFLAASSLASVVTNEARSPPVREDWALRPPGPLSSAHVLPRGCPAQPQGRSVPPALTRWWHSGSDPPLCLVLTVSELPVW